VCFAVGLIMHFVAQWIGSRQRVILCFEIKWIGQTIRSDWPAAWHFKFLPVVCADKPPAGTAKYL